MRRMLEALDASQLGELAGLVVLAIGMTPSATVTVPPPVEGCSWAECYERGLERLSRPADLR
jgi:hypothetical protein